MRALVWFATVVLVACGNSGEDTGGSGGTAGTGGTAAGKAIAAAAVSRVVSGSTTIQPVRPSISVRISRTTSYWIVIARAYTGSRSGEGFRLRYVPDVSTYRLRLRVWEYPTELTEDSHSNSFTQRWSKLVVNDSKGALNFVDPYFG